jgi:hypothetical protein
MGLDMYLTAKRYVWKHLDEEQSLQSELNKVMEEELCSTDMRVSEVSVNAFYWRKANAIHKWFVDNVQGGEDNCREYWVQDTQLKQLLQLCQLALEHKDKPDKILPTADGFFFGSTDYEEWYWADIENTIEGLEKVLQLDTSKWDFYYRASW